MSFHSVSKMILLLFHFLQLTVTVSQNVTIYGKCSFAEPTFPKRNEMSVSTLIQSGLAQLSIILSCNVWYNNSNGILRMWLQKRSLNEQTYLISTVLDQHGLLVLPGYVAEAEESIAYPFHICPPKEQRTDRNYSILLSAPPETHVNLTVQVDESVLQKGETKSLDFSYKVSSRLLVFDVPTLSGIHDHFLVTVRSKDTEQESLLIVSNECSDVSAFDPLGMDFKEIGSSLRLSFTTFGRITLSHASRPKLGTGRWFIGIFLKQPQRRRCNGNADECNGKTVHVSVGFASGVDRGPVIYLFFVSLFGGLIIALFSEFFLNPEYKHRFIQDFHYYLNTHVFKTNVRDNVDAKQEGNEINPANLTPTPGPTPTPSIRHDIQIPNTSQVASFDLVNLRLTRHWPGFKRWANVILSWFYDEQKTYAYMTAIVACSLLTGAAQFIILNWQDMIDSGNRDTCYYNEGCYRATTDFDIPYNLIVSNMSYIIHGIIFALSLSLREATHRMNYGDTKRKNFSVYYALAWALVFEGVFSSMYHVCPSRLAFQFDSAFMFVISGLVVVAVFNSVAEKANIRQSSESGRNMAPIQDTKLFLFFVIPLLLLNYLGSIRDTNGFLMISQVAFYCLVILWLAIMFAWAFYRLMLPWQRKPGPAFWCKFGWLCVMFPGLLLIIGFYTIDVKKDWSHFFLFMCITCVMCAVTGYCLTKCASNIYNRTMHRDVSADEKTGLRCRMYFKWPVVNFYVVIYIAGVVFCWALAFHYFQREPVTAKVKRPSQSRQFNKECVLWEFFDYHDMWHILSSFALLLSAYLIVWSIG